MIHSMNVGHSYSDRKVRVGLFFQHFGLCFLDMQNIWAIWAKDAFQIFPYSAPGEYDDKYDLMSTANAHMRPSTYGLGGPGLNGPHLDYLGWLPQNRVVYFGR